MTKMYKVVTSMEGGLYSVTTRGEHCLIYTPGEWTKPTLEGSKIFVFADKHQALVYADWGITTTDEVWGVEVKGAEPEYKYIVAAVEEDYLDFWQKNDCKHGYHYLDVHEAWVVDEVKLIRRVDDNENTLE